MSGEGFLDFYPGKQNGPMTPDETPESPTIKLDHFLKFVGVVGTGGAAKVVIQGGAVQVNGQVETRRRRTLRSADVVEFEGASYYRRI